MQKKHKFFLSLLAILLALTFGTGIMAHNAGCKAADTALFLCESNEQWYDYTA